MIEYTVKVDNDGTKRWFLNGKQHREDGPAAEWSSGDKFWYLNGELHREDGPAIEGGNGTKRYLNGKLHREDGPAIERADGHKFWYLNGQSHSEQEFNNRTQVQELTIRELEQKLGYKIKIKGESYNESINK